MKKIKIATAAAVTVAAVLGLYSVFAAGINESWDFENGSVPNWTALYSNANMAVLTENESNKYLKLSYNGQANRGRKYYDVKVSYTSGDIIQADYDVMYDDITSEKDGDIQFKLRTGPGSSETTMVARVGKNMDYFRIHGEDGNYFAAKDLKGNTLKVEEDRWYSVKIIVDLVNKKQSVYIFDRDTQELLSCYENISTIGGNNRMNMITFSSGENMYLDNVRIYNPVYETGQICGSPYVSSSTSSQYYFLGQESDGNVTALPEGATTWSLAKAKTGVSISSDGKLTVYSQPEPGPVILCAKKETANGTIQAKYIVNISK